MHKNGALQMPTPGIVAGAHLAEVTDIADPEGLARVQVKLLNYEGLDDQIGILWARVAVPFGGDGYGGFFIPDVGEEVLVTFINGDPRMPIVVGSLWNGAAAPPEQPGGDRIDRWTITGKAGTRIAIEEETAGEETVTFTTPGGVSGQLTDSGGGTIELEAAGSTVTIDSSGVKIKSPSAVEVEATSVTVKAGTVTVDAAMSRFAGVVQCDTIIATSVVGSTYTPGAGNVW